MAIIESPLTRSCCFLLPSVFSVFFYLPTAWTTVLLLRSGRLRGDTLRGRAPRVLPREVYIVDRLNYYNCTLLLALHLFGRILRRESRLNYRP